MLYYCAENKGRTLHLLKKAAKPVPQNRKRVKRDIFASPLDFQRHHPDFAEERKGEPEMEPEPVQVNPLGHVPAGGGPNIIGNLEDGPVLPDQRLSPALGRVQEQPGTPQSAHSSPAFAPKADESMDDSSQFRPITPQRTAAQVARMANRRTKSKEPPKQ